MSYTYQLVGLSLLVLQQGGLHVNTVDKKIGLAMEYWGNPVLHSLAIHAYFREVGEAWYHMNQMIAAVL